MKILNQKSKILNCKNGFIFLEILIAIALVGIVFITLLGIGVQSLGLSYTIQKTTQIDSLLKEEMEATRSFRDGTNWSTDGLGVVSTGSANPYHLILSGAFNPPKWILQTGIEAVGEFTRQVVFDKVSRDPFTHDIESIYNTANDDSKTRKITASVVYGGKTYQVIAYLTNWKNN